MLVEKRLMNEKTNAKESVKTESVSSEYMIARARVNARKLDIDAVLSGRAFHVLVATYGNEKSL